MDSILGTDRKGTIVLERNIHGTERNDFTWNGLFMERNGTDFYGTDLVLEQNINKYR